MYNLFNKLFPTMKKALLFSAAFAALGLLSCNREVSPSVGSEGKPVEVTVSIMGAPSSRATDTKYADESKVDSLQIFVFNGDDREAYRNVKNTMSALIPATSGERTVWAVVNAPDLSEVMSLNALKAAVTNLVDNAKDSFVMTGAVTQELVDGGNVAITVKRIVARVSISRISTSLKDYREKWSVRIGKIYLINVAADNKYDVGGEPGAWLNKLAWDAEAGEKADALLYDVLGADGAGVIIKNNVYQKDGETVDEDHAYDEQTHRLASGVSIVQDNGYTKEHAFYPYPNPYPVENTTPDYGDTWTPRGTILVIEATMLDEDGNEIVIQGTDNQTQGYYPIPMPALERNKTYVIDEVRITRLPGDKPYKPIETGESRVTITVNEWELGLNLGTITI